MTAPILADTNLSFTLSTRLSRKSKRRHAYCYCDDSARKELWRYQPLCLVPFRFQPVLDPARRLLMVDFTNQCRVGLREESFTPLQYLALPSFHIYLDEFWQWITLLDKTV